MLTLNDNRPESPLAVVNAALGCAKTARAPAAALNERDERLCQICDYLWLVLAALRKLPRVPRSLLYCPCRRTPGRAPPRVGERLVAPGFVYARTQWDVAKRAAEDERGTLFVLHECWGYAVAPLSFFGHDNDLLLEPGTQFRVDEVAQKERYTVVHLYRRDAPLYLERRMASERAPDILLPLPQVQPQQQETPQTEQKFDSQQQSVSLAGNTAVAVSGVDPVAAVTTSSASTATPSSSTPTGSTISGGGVNDSNGDETVCMLETARTLPTSQTLPNIHDVAVTGTLNTSSSSIGVPPDSLLARSMGTRGALGAGAACINTGGGGASNNEDSLVTTSPTQKQQQQQQQQETKQSTEEKQTTETSREAFFPSNRSEAMRILDDNHLFFFPDNVNGTPLAAALASAKLARADELRRAAATFVELRGDELLPEDGTTLAAVRSPAFARADAEVLAMLTTNDTRAGGVLAAVNDCLARTAAAEMADLADLLWYVLAALRKLAADARAPALYRGLCVPAGAPLPAVGARIVWSELFYAALDAEAAVQTLRDLCADPAARLVVVELRGARGYDMRPYSFLGHDAVRLVEPGLAFRVAALDALPSGALLVRAEYLPAPLLLEHRMAPYVPPAVPTTMGNGNGSDLARPRYTFGFAPVSGGNGVGGSGTNKKDSKEQREADALFSSFAPDTAALDLSGKCLSAVPRAVYALPGLRVLQLHCNALTAKHLAFPPGAPGAPAPLQGLQELVLSQNQLATLPDCFAGLCNLQTLALDHNALRAVPPCVAAMTRLRVLDLSANRVRALPDTFTQLRDLQVLRIADNQLEALPANIGALTNLHTLNLAGNRLRALPDTVGALVRLQQLRITQNQLQSLPASFALLTQFRELDLAHNQLDKVPECLAHLPVLARLDLDDNKLKLKALPQWLFLLPALQSLRLTNNPCASKAKGLTLLSKNPVET